MRTKLLLFVLVVVSVLVGSYRVGGMDKLIDKNVKPTTIIVQTYGNRVHAFSYAGSFSLSTDDDSTPIAIAQPLTNAGFQGWVLDTSVNVPYVLLDESSSNLQNIQLTDQTIGWSWVSNNNLLVMDFPVDATEVEAWLYKDENLVFHCIPGGRSEAIALAKEFVNPLTHKHKALSLHMYLKNSFPMIEC